MRARSGGAAVLIGAALCLASSCNRDADIEPLLAEARELGARGEDIEAARLLRSKIDGVAAAQRGGMWLAMARHHQRSGLHLNVLEDLDAALAAGMGGAESLYLRGESLRRLGRLAEAETALAECLSLEPRHHLAQLSLAAIRFRSSDPASALPLFESYFRAAAPVEDRYGEALLEHGRALRAAGRHQEAADRFMLLLERQPLECESYSELASALYRLRRREEGRFVEEIYKLVAPASFGQGVEKSLREGGSAGIALAQRASNQVRERRYLSAFRSYRRAVEVEPATPVIRVHFAQLCLRFRRFQDGRSTVEEGLRFGLEPRSGLWWTLARIHLEERDFARAVPALRKAADLLREEGDRGGVELGQAPPSSLLLLRARAALETGDLQAARDVAMEAERLLLASWESPYLRGRAELARGDAAGAAALFAEALRRGGAPAVELSFWSAVALEESGRRDEALARFNAIRQSSPGHLPIYEPLQRLEPDPARRASFKNAAANLAGLRAEIEALERAIGGRPVDGSPEELRRLVKLLLRLQDPSAIDQLFLLAELLPRDAEVLKLLLAGTKQPKDIFVRAHLLRRLLEVEPGSGEAKAELAAIYRKLHVRLDDPTKN